MKLMTNFLILAFAGTALAQVPAAKPGATTAANAKPAQAAPAKPAQAAPAKPMQATTNSKVAPNTTAKPQTAAAKPQAVAAKPVTTAAQPATAPAKVATKAAKPAVKKEAPAKKAVAKKEAAPAKPEAAAEPKDQKPGDTEAATAKNHRDPFVSVVVSRDGAPCSGGGKKCIDIAQVTLQGVVRAPSGPIAVISSGSSKTYFLRENDPVYNGVVVKISPDSIVFRETVMDRVGKTTQREVVKKIHNAPAV